MTKIMQISFLCISFLSFFLLAGCGDKIQDNKNTNKVVTSTADGIASKNNIIQTAGISQDKGKTEVTVTLPAAQIKAQNIIIPDGGISTKKAKEIVVQYLKGEGVRGDIQAHLSMDEITIKEAWENVGVQLYMAKLGYASIYSIAVVKDGKVLSLIGSMPVYEVFMADLDMDSKYEIYANTAFGSGIVSDDVSGYNIVTNTKYYMSKRMEKDFKLFIKDNMLFVKEYSYGNLRKTTSYKTKTLKIQKDKLLLEQPFTGFAVYKVKGESISKALSFGRIESRKYRDTEKNDLSILEVENAPLFTDKDIEKYIWDTNTIIFNTGFLKEHVLTQEDIKRITENKTLESGRLLSFYGGSRLLKCSDAEAVLIVVGEDRIYSSGFVLSTFSSRWPPSDITLGDSDINSIGIESTPEFEKMIKDKRIFDYFKKLGKLVE